MIDRYRCRTCSWWNRGGNRFADEPPTTSEAADIGTCQASTPWLHFVDGVPRSLWNVTAAGSGCGSWERPGNDDDDPPLNMSPDSSAPVRLPPPKPRRVSSVRILEAGEEPLPAAATGRARVGSLDELLAQRRGAPGRA